MIGGIRISLKTDQQLLCSGLPAIRQFPASFDDEETLLGELLAVINLLKKETLLLSVDLLIEVSRFVAVPVDLPEKNEQKDLLSRREKEVLSMMFNGLTSKEIAQQLFISFETVKSHRKNILVKTGSKNTAALTKNLDKSLIEDLKK